MIWPPPRRVLGWRGLNEFSATGIPHLSLRAMPKGGPLATVGMAEPRDLLVDQNHLILLVHGYNNSQEEAFESYRAFLGKLSNPWIASTAVLYWPGDSWTSKLGARSSSYSSSVRALASYPWQPDRARQAAEMMVETINAAIDARKAVARERKGPVPRLSLDIVAHSMGCRVILELFRLLAAGLRYMPLEIRTVVLMAAAVPLYRVQERGELAKALTLADKTYVYWSTVDDTLRRWFPLGEALEWPFPRGWSLWGREALGLCGIAAGDRLVVDRCALDHDEYWSNDEIASQVEAELMAVRQPQRRRVFAAPASAKRSKPGRRLAV
jgi:pimeloyl-ACP methyl ester carboxylesterase